MRFALVLILSLVSVANADDKVHNWVKVTDKAGWQPRDSQGEVVFKDQLWIFGGWFDSFHAPPRDMWSSPDGKTWKKTGMPDLPFRSIDTGMGLERTAAVLGGLPSVYDTDVFTPIFTALEGVGAPRYGGNLDHDRAQRRRDDDGPLDQRCRVG